MSQVETLVTVFEIMQLLSRPAIYQFKLLNTSSIEFQQTLRISCGIAYMWSPFIALSEIWFILNQYGCNQNFFHNIHWECLIENFKRVCKKNVWEWRFKVFRTFHLLDWQIVAFHTASTSWGRSSRKQFFLWTYLMRPFKHTHTQAQTYTRDVYTWRVKSPCAPVAGRI